MTESLLLVLALAAIGAAAWFAYRSAGVDPIRTERDRLRAELQDVRRQNLDLATELAAAKAQRAERSESEEARFMAIAAQALEKSQANFMALANETFERHKQAAQGGVKEVLTPAQEALAKLATSVDALEKARLQDKSAINEQVRQMVEAVGTTNKTTTQLLSALRASPKMRGRWGEQTLRNVLELSGLSAHVDFKEQFSATDGEGARLRPDVVINLPGGRCIVVDSKVALSGYLDAVDAGDDAARELHLKKHVAELKGHVKNLASKDYQKHVPATAEFVVLFVPGENFLAAAAERDPNLFDEAFAQKVIITTPTTMVALAKSIAYGWRQEDSAKNTQKIAELGRDLHRRMGVLLRHVDDLGKAIVGANDKYASLVGSLERQVLPQTRKFRELGAADDEDVVTPRVIETAPRLPSPQPELDLAPPPQSGR